MTGPYRIPVVSIVGKSDSGKTTVMEGLIRALTDRGYRVATCKHHVHEVDIDVPGKDSWRHARAGAATTMISSPTQFATVRRTDRDRTLEELVEAAGDVDVLLTEGFQRAGEVRIEVCRSARSTERVNDPAALFAIVTDNPEAGVDVAHVFGLDETGSLAALIADSFLEGGE